MRKRRCLTTWHENTSASLHTLACHISHCLFALCQVAVVCLMINDSTESVNKHIFDFVDVVVELKKNVEGDSPPG